MAKEIKGVIPPLTTPFTGEGAVYDAGLRRLLDFQLEKGTHGVFICGTYGSGPIMSVVQRKRVAEITLDQVGGRMAVIVHVGTTSTSQSVELARHAESIGADAIAAVPPFYYRHGDEAVFAFYQALLDSVGLPLFVYNNPKTTGFTLKPDLLRKLAGAGVQGIKESGFSFVEFTHFVLALEAHPDFVFIIGSEALLLPAMMVGAKGCVSGLANAFPEIVISLYDAVCQRRFDEAAELQLQVNALRQAMHIAASTYAACYRLLKERGIDVGQPKPPILPVPEEEAMVMIQECKRLGLL